MILNLAPPPQFHACRTVRFRPNHQHITRTYYRVSVLILMLDGELRFREDGKEIHLVKDEYYIQRDGLFQEGIPIDDPPSYFYIEFFGSYSEAPFGLPLRGTYKLQKIQTFIDRLTELFNKNKQDSRHIRPDANLFILNAYMNHIFNELFVGSTTTDKNSTLTYMIQSHIQSNFSKKITLTDLSKRFGYDKDYLSEMFKKQYGVTPSHYQTNLRMEQARWMLETTSLSAEQVALSVGYADFSTFYRNFKNCYGIAPSSFRALNKAENRKVNK